MLLNFFGDTLHQFIFLSALQNSANLMLECDLFQIKVLGKYTEETKLTRYFKKVTAHPSFTRLRVIKRIDRVH